MPGIAAGDKRCSLTSSGHAYLQAFLKHLVVNSSASRCAASVPFCTSLYLLGSSYCAVWHAASQALADSGITMGCWASFTEGSLTRSVLGNSCPSGSWCDATLTTGQFEVVQYRMKDEYGVDTTLEPLSFSIARYGSIDSIRVTLGNASASNALDLP
eukprot:1158545-Pelagomonas_calceolata.AAC.10